MRIHGDKTEHGVYRTMERIALEFGYQVSPDKALQSAKKYVEKGIFMAGRWCGWCDMTKQWLYVHLEQRWVEEFADGWQIFEKYAESAHIVFWRRKISSDEATTR